MTVKFEMHDYLRNQIVNGEMERDKDFPDFTYTYTNVEALVRSTLGDYIMICKNQWDEIWREEIPATSFKIVLVLP